MLTCETRSSVIGCRTVSLRLGSAHSADQAATGHGVITEKRPGRKRKQLFLIHKKNTQWNVTMHVPKKESWILLFSCAMSCQIRLHWFASMRKVALFCKICFANSFGYDKHYTFVFTWYRKCRGGETDQGTNAIPPSYRRMVIFVAAGRLL